MSLTMAILMLLGLWGSVASAMLWGVLRILRRHAPTPPSPAPDVPSAKAKAKAKTTPR